MSAMGRQPVQRQRLPSSDASSSDAVICTAPLPSAAPASVLPLALPLGQLASAAPPCCIRDADSAAWQATATPGLQKPHWLPWNAARRAVQPAQGASTPAREVSGGQQRKRCQGCSVQASQPCRVCAVHAPCTSWKPWRVLPRPSDVSTWQPPSSAAGSRQLLTATGTLLPGRSSSTAHAPQPPSAQETLRDCGSGHDAM